MQSVRKLVASVALVSTALLAATIVAPFSAQGGPTVSGTVAAQQSGPWNVGIAGTPDVTVANTPTVTVANTPNVLAAQSGQWIVGLAGTPAVTIANTPDVHLADPVVVADDKTPARYEGWVKNDGNPANTPVAVAPPVPADKVFIANYVNVMGYGWGATPLTGGHCFLRGGASSMYVFVPMTLTSEGFLSSREQTFIPVHPGEALQLDCYAAPDDSHSNFYVTVGGYFVAAP